MFNNFMINAKAEFFRSAINGTGLSYDTKNTLQDFGVSNFLPKTISDNLLVEPVIKNPLRDISTFTNIAGLEIPKINFFIDEYDFLDTDSETGKEIEATGDLVEFKRNKIKVFVPISDTLMLGSNTNLVGTVENALQSALALKEKQIAFLSEEQKGSVDIGSAESFYTCSPSIKKINASSMFEGITEALADLEDEFSENATVVMRKVDYFNMIRELSNNSTTLYGVQPKVVLGCNVVFCDKAIKPVIGDFRYSHFNYDPNMTYDKDKNVRTGVYDFVLTGWVDHKIKLKSAFRIVEIN